MDKQKIQDSLAEIEMLQARFPLDSFSRRFNEGRLTAADYRFAKQMAKHFADLAEAIKSLDPNADDQPGFQSQIYEAGDIP